jgi:cephalosporin hydroxylase
MGEITKFDEEKRDNIEALGRDPALKKLGMDFDIATSKYKYTYNFTWLGLPIIQFPQDIFAMQEIIWQVKPDLVIETGIAHGGSLIFYASMMELLGRAGKVIGVDIEIRKHNRVEIERHPMFKRITMIEGSSIDEEVIERVADASQGSSSVLVVLDSNHTHEHVLRELELYSPFVTKGSYLVVFDTAIEQMPEGFFQDRPWGKGNNPMTAVKEFLSKTDRFVVDSSIEHKLLITVAPHGYLQCIKD